MVDVNGVMKERIVGEMKERIAEMAITEWEGARIEVRISLPQIGNSLTTQRYIDSRELEELKALNPPEELDLLLDTNPDMGRFELMKWQDRKEKAKNLLKAISDQISWQIGNAIAQDGFK